MVILIIFVIEISVIIVVVFSLKKILGLLVLTILLMYLCPFILAKMVNGSDGLALLFILLFFVNPIYSIMVGIAAGKDFYNSLYYPFVVAIIFVSGYMIVFETNDYGLLVYAGIYLLLAVTSMVITYLIEKKNSESE